MSGWCNNLFPGDIFSRVSIEAGNRQIPPPASQIIDCYSTFYIKFHLSCFCHHLVIIQYWVWCQNTGNVISRLLDSKIFWGSMPPDPPSGRGLTPPEVLQLPTLIGSAAFLLKPLILIMKIKRGEIPWTCTFLGSICTDVIDFNSEP